MYKLWMTLVLAALAPWCAAQTIALFTVDQPPQFLAEAGDEQYYFGDPVQLGGAPTAAGGSGEYSFMWSPTDWLDDSNIPNPTVSGLMETTVYTVTVTDVANGCIKIDSIQVNMSVGIQDLGEGGSMIYPNPASTTVRIEGVLPIQSVVMYDLTGKEVLRSGHAPSLRVDLDLLGFSDGMYVVQVNTENGHRSIHRLCKSSAVR